MHHLQSRLTNGMVRDGLFFKKANDMFYPLRMRQPGLLLVTADNYFVGKVSTIGHDYVLLGLYERNNGQYVRVKVPVGNRQPPLVMEPDEIEQFPERYYFHIPNVTSRHYRSY